ncbi:hypothetical protein EW146_g2418 [Bondarzewia mesenterica]|uniref:Uncharacterized protein n=1 Tax=Bondarzewia mesenterica TaxID=1095465 RepID=A0A4V3XFR6_9AGAM|nr:hypothetical protein EW146_g2418 [Bondarzewia mesenterica]
MGDETGGVKKRSKYSIVLPIPQIPPIPVYESPPLTPPALEMAYLPSVFVPPESPPALIPADQSPAFGAPDSPPALTPAHVPASLPVSQDLSSERSSSSPENRSVSFHPESPVVLTHSPIEHRPPNHSSYSSTVTFQPPQGGAGYLYYPSAQASMSELDVSSALISGMPAPAPSYNPYEDYDAPALPMVSSSVSDAHMSSQDAGALQHNSVLLQPVTQESYISVQQPTICAPHTSYGHPHEHMHAPYSESPSPDNPHSYPSSFGSGQSTPIYGIADSMTANEPLSTTPLVHTTGLAYTPSSNHANVYHQHVALYHHPMPSYLHYGATAHSEVH